MENFKTITVYSFSLSDVDDPHIWAAKHLYKFENTELGKWLMTNCIEKPFLHEIPCDYGWQYYIKAKLSEKQFTYYSLKYN